MSDREPVSLWIERIKAGDQDAAAKLWATYYDRLIRLVCHRMRGAKRRVSDEEDVVARAFETFFRRAKAESFPKLHDPDDLWQLLVTITDCKAKNLVRAEKRKKRGGGTVRGESGFYGNAKKKKLEDSRGGTGADQFAGDGPTPEFTATMADYFEHLLDLLDDDLREIALLKLEGRGDDEIAKHIGRSTRTVNRRVSLIREKWKRAEEADA
jgi:DNA-directed RNA polymerase specialized sigma24 family protein